MPDGGNQHDIRAIADMLAERMPDLTHELIGDPTHRSRGELRFRRRGSLSVKVAGPKRGSWFDHEAGAGGDPLGLVAHLRRTSMREARSWALGWLGLAAGTATPRQPRRPVAPPARESRPSDTGDLARRVWAEAVAADAPSSLVPVYLASRGLEMEPDAPLRFHPACPRGAERWPAMVTLMTDPTTGQPCGVHRTFLARDGSGKAPGPMPAKMMAGNAGIIRLVPDEEVTMGLGIAEGIETSLAVMQGFGWRPVWAAASAGAIRAFPVLPGLGALTVFSDPDGAGMAAANECARRWEMAGREARVCAPPRGDFNDLIQEHAA